VDPKADCDQIVFYLYVVRFHNKYNI